jgi:hypothetical protein
MGRLACALWSDLARRPLGRHWLSGYNDAFKPVKTCGLALQGRRGQRGHHERSLCASSAVTNSTATFPSLVDRSKEAGPIRGIHMALRWEMDPVGQEGSGSRAWRVLFGSGVTAQWSSRVAAGQA